MEVAAKPDASVSARCGGCRFGIDDADRDTLAVGFPRTKPMAGADIDLDLAVVAVA